MNSQINLKSESTKPCRAALWFGVAIISVSGCSGRGSKPAVPAAKPTPTAKVHVWTPPPTDPMAQLKQQALDRDVPGATATYQDICKANAADQQMRLRAGLLLAEALATVTPFNEPDATRLLGELEPMLGESAAPDLKQRHNWLRFVVQLRGLGSMLAADASAYETWNNRLLELADKLPADPPQAGIVAEALNLVALSPAAKQTATAERLDQLALDLQCTLAAPRLAPALQQCRVRALAAAGRNPEALAEGRILLALVAQNPTDLPQAIGDVQAVIKQGSGAETPDDKFKLFQLHGPSGPDLAANTPDDPANPLTQVKRDNPYLAKKLAKLGEAKPDQASARLKLGYALLLAGNADEARKCFTELASSGSQLQEAEAEAAVTGLADADALQDGHILESDRSICALLAAKDQSSISPLWRYEAARFLTHRANALKTLNFPECAPAVLGICRSMLDDWADPEYRDQLFTEVVQACKVLNTDAAPTAWLTRFHAFGKALKNPDNRLTRARLAAEQYLQAGQTEPAIIELDEAAQGLPPVTDPNFVLARALCMLRQGKAEEAINLIKNIPDSTEASAPTAARAQLLMVAIYLQKGQVIEARETLDRIIREHPGTEYQTRASAILQKI